MSDNNPPRRVSVVIRALNEGKHIGRLLKGLEQQTVKLDEVILVDSGSTDNTVAIAEAAGCTVVHIAKNEFSFGRALNKGCAAASGDILLFASAHVYPVYNWLDPDRLIHGLRESCSPHCGQEGSTPS